MDLIELGCSCLDVSNLKTFMDAAGLLGRGFTPPLIAAALWLYGYYAKNTKAVRLGWAVLAALLVSTLVVNLLKLGFQLPRPTARPEYGFPSGDSATAFSSAAAIAAGFPALAALSYSLATLAAVARLYSRAHYVVDVGGGALIGIVCGTYFARRIVRERSPRPGSWSASIGWCGIGLVALATGVFFLRLESRIAQHRIVNDRSTPPTSPAVEIDFGTDSARPYLTNGWSPNYTRREPTLSINWVVGRDAALNVPLDPGRHYLARFRAYPHQPTGFTCQWIELRLNDRLVRRVYLEQGWNSYGVSIPKALLRDGANHVGLHFSDTADWHGVDSGRRPSIVAFDTMQFIPDGVD